MLAQRIFFQLFWARSKELAGVQGVEPPQTTMDMLQTHSLGLYAPRLSRRGKA
jgi:hypothetical protein